jgi:histidinol-phosphatase
MNSDWRSRYEAAIEAARQAGQIALRYYDAAVAVEWKPDASPVTVADREAEQHLRTALLGKFPADGFLGEEYGDHPGSSGFRWIVDPIDGTRSFVRNVPVWATLVGLEHRGDMIAGVVVAPALGNVYHALRGDGAYRDGRRIHVSDIDRLADAQLFYSSVSWFARADRKEGFLDLSGRTQRQRGFGDYWGFVLVAQGSGEVMVDHGVHAWDVAAVLPIVEEAGGRLTDWDGNRTIHRPDVLASNGRLHDEALAILRGNDGKL